MAANNLELAKLVHERIAPMIAEYGLELPAFYVENISLPAEVEAALDKRTATGVAGDLSRYTEFSAAEAMTKAAANPGGGGGIGAGLGAGMGMAMAERMARTRPLGRRPGGRGPAAAAAGRRAALARRRRRAGQGALHPRRARAAWRRRARSTRDTYLWTPGGPDWVRGRDVTELADLFSAPPPPPAA